MSEAPPTSGLLPLLLKSLLLIGLLLLGIVVLGTVLRPELTSLGRLFVERFGPLGMFIGTFLADAFSFPIPPQFYLLTAVVSGGSPVVPIIVVSLASILGGHTGYRLARPLATHPLVHRLRHRSQERVDGLFRRYGYWAVAVGAIAPVPFPVLCWAAGLYHVSFPLFSLFTLLRVPRILFFYFLFRFGWGG